MNTFEAGKLPVIEGEGVALRPITEADTELIVRWRNESGVMKNFIFRERLTGEMHRRWLETKVAAGEVVQYIILGGEERRAVGSAYLRDIDPRFECAEFGIFIGESEARGKGWGTESARLLCDFGFKELGLHRISLRVLGGNDAALRSYEKAGFKAEGRFRDMVKLDGEFHDVIFMARLAGEER